MSREPQLPQDPDDVPPAPSMLDALRDALPTVRRNVSLVLYGDPDRIDALSAERAAAEAAQEAAAEAARQHARAVRLGRGALASLLLYGSFILVAVELLVPDRTVDVLVLVLGALPLALLSIGLFWSLYDTRDRDHAGEGGDDGAV